MKGRGKSGISVCRSCVYPEDRYKAVFKLKKRAEKRQRGAFHNFFEHHVDHPVGNRASVRRQRLSCNPPAYLAGEHQAKLSGSDVLDNFKQLRFLCAPCVVTQQQASCKSVGVHQSNAGQ